MDNQTVGAIVAQDYRAASVFKRHGIDFCCGGKRSVSEACAAKGVDVEEVSRELDALARRASPLQASYAEWSAGFLADYVVNRHHSYIRKALPEITAYAEKVARVHGGRHPELLQLLYTWKALASELESHLLKEEQVLFPYVRQLNATSGALAPPPFGALENPVRMMELEHEDAGDMMRAIRELSRDFTPPEDACTTYRVLFHMLEEFEGDLHEHIHIENNILFPKAAALEESLMEAR